MTLPTHRGEGPAFPYAGQPVHILTGQDGRPPGFAAMELTVPGHFTWPIPEPALLLGIWAPPAPALTFMRDIGAALAPGTAPDPELMRDIYARHASRLLP